MPLPASMPERANGGRRITKAQEQANTLELYRGRKRLALIRDIAMGEWSNRELAKQLGVQVFEVATFSALHSDEITEVRAALAGHLAIETAGLWISKRHNRVAELQAQVEDLVEDVAMARREDRGSKEHINLARTLLIALKNAGEEYLPTRIDKSERDSVAPPERYILEVPDDIMKAIT